MLRLQQELPMVSASMPPCRISRACAKFSLRPALLWLLLLCATQAGAAPPPRAAAPTATATVPASTPTAQVTLSLTEYERLTLHPAVTVIDSIRLTGSFQSHNLGIVFTGRSSGYLPKVEVLAAPPGVRIYGCDGDAILSRNDSGQFEVTPLHPKFSLHCQVATTGSDRLHLESTPAVLYVDSQVQDGELVNTEEAVSADAAPSSRKSFAIVRVSATATETLAPTATARYRLTLQPEGTLFHYQLEVHNPNRSHQPFVVRLQSGEHVQTINTTASYEPSGHEYRFQLPPGELSITLTGTLQQTAFRPPVSASVQYMLLESHPLLRATISTAAQHISANETGLTARFRGAQGFLLSDKDSLSWQAQRLEVLRTTSYAVHSAQHLFFLGTDGQVLGETALKLDNQGASALQLPMSADPTFASIQGEPVFLTKNRDGALWLPLGQGAQSVLLQHRQSFSRVLGLGVGSLHLPELEEAASSASIELRYEQQWVPLYEEFAPEVRLPALGVAEVFGFVVLVLWCQLLLAALSIGRGLRMLMATLLALAALTNGIWLGLLTVVNLALSALIVLPWLLGRRWNFWSTVIGLCGGGLACLLVAATLLTSGRSMAPSASSDSWVRERKEDAAGGRADGKPEPPRDAPSYQGLPAKVMMPHGDHHSFIQREMLTSKARAVRVVMLYRPVLTAAGDMLLGLALLLLVTQLRPVRRALRDRWELLQKVRLHTPARAE